MKSNTILIFEFVSGGGFNQVDIPSSLFCEGFGMLRSIIDDFKKLDLEILTLLDYRISHLSKYLEANTIKQVNANDDYVISFKKLLKKSNFCFIIAPEFSNILYNLTKIVKDHNKKLLSVDLEAISIGSSKIKTFDFFKKYSLKTPETYQIPFKSGLDVDFIVQKLNQFNSPIIIKPEDGVGAENIYYFENSNQVYTFFKESEFIIDPNRTYIVQKFIEGRDLSMSLVGTNQSVSYQNLVLSLNQQDINIKNCDAESEYIGGYTPIENYDYISNQLKNFFKTVDLSKFSSYYGIDFINSQEGISFIEINPRLTTSYIGIRNITPDNIAKLIYNAHYNQSEFKGIKIQNHSSFARYELEYLGNSSIKYIEENFIPELLEKIPEFITPPISFDRLHTTINQHYSCFIATKEKNMKNSRIRIKEIFNVLKEFDFSIIK